MDKIKIAIAGVGNCASALVQGITYYGKKQNAVPLGLMHPLIGGWSCGDIEVVAAFDIDERKVGFPLHEAIYAAPNCAAVFEPNIPHSNVLVHMSPILDGYSEHMGEFSDNVTFRPAAQEPVDVAQMLSHSGAEILVCYLPVGSEQAVIHFAEACLKSKVAMINCVPVFIASNAEWAARFKDAGVPIIGDDIKSQVGATIVHRTLSKLFANRGVSIDRTYQLNTGGNTDFLNMLSRERLTSKKISKSESVQSQLANRLTDSDIHIGPSDYIPWQKDNKLCFLRIEGTGFGDQKIEIELRMSVQDSPNSAGVVIDAIRCAKLALDRNLAGPIESVSSFCMKTPPVQFSDTEAFDKTEEFINQYRPMPVAVELRK